jgi:predicted acyltransferase
VNGYNPAVSTSSIASPIASPIVENERLLSLDVFRGFTILLMLVVNDGNGHSFAQLDHAAWNGWTLTDLVFPFFLFIAGVSIPFAFARRVNGEGAERGDWRLRMLPHILRRAAIIFGLGLLINGFPHYHLASLRFAGVLQRIAVCYVAGSLLYLWSGTRRTGTRVRWAVIGGLLVGYWMLMRFVPVPGFGVPTVDIPLLDPQRNLAAWLDRKVMMGHLFEHTSDPEGILSTLPAVATILLGVAVGEWIGALRGDWPRLLRRMAAVGAACFVGGELWGRIFPVNKSLWTSSYVLVTAGLAMISLAVCYYLVDVRRLRGRWMVVPMVFGTNCIFAYAFSMFVALVSVKFTCHLDGQLATYKDAVNQFTFDNIPNPQWASLGYALFFTTFCWCVTWVLYRRKVFLKV